MRKIFSQIQYETHVIGVCFIMMEWICQLLSEQQPAFMDTMSETNYTATRSIPQIIPKNMTENTTYQNQSNNNISILHLSGGHGDENVNAYFKEATENILKADEPEWGGVLVLTYIIIPIICTAGILGNLLNLIILTRRVGILNGFIVFYGSFYRTCEKNNPTVGIS